MVILCQEKKVPSQRVCVGKVEVTGNERLPTYTVIAPG